MNPADHSTTAFYGWTAAVCVVGWLVTTYLLLDADITMRWAHNQYEIHQETALQISSLIWAPVFALSTGVRALIRYVYRSRRNAI
jgi:cytochrome b561